MGFHSSTPFFFFPVEAVKIFKVRTGKKRIQRFAGRLIYLLSSTLLYPLQQGTPGRYRPGVFPFSIRKKPCHFGRALNRSTITDADESAENKG